MTSTARSVRLSPYWRATASTRDGNRAFRLLYGSFVFVPIVAGFDKFADKLANWSGYLAPIVTETIPLRPDALMRIVGVVEIAAGMLVALRPRIGAYVVAAWLAAIIVNLFALGHYWDVALRDFGLLLGALSLACLSPRHAT
ncbi:MAG TPA: hypothetical protein VMS65_10210 [Polyangiaceae bacterium]|nr:hypothetical protein [Polyangiaceae bacterium]